MAWSRPNPAWTGLVFQTSEYFSYVGQCSLDRVGNSLFPTFALSLFTLSLQSHFKKEQWAWFTPVAHLKRATRAICNLKRANHTFSLKKRVIGTKKQRVNSWAGNFLICFPRESLVFCPKMSLSAIRSKKMSDSLIRSFLVSDLSDLLMIAHFLWAMWTNRSWSLIFDERLERFAHDRSPKKREWALRSFFK